MFRPFCATAAIMTPPVISSPLDFDHHSAEGLTDDVEVFLPLLAQAGFADAILWSPPADRGELLESGLELAQAVGERRRRVCLPSGEQAQEFLDRLGVGHH